MKQTKTISLLAALTTLCLYPVKAYSGTCAIVSIAPVNFGNYNPFSKANNDTTGTVTFNCTGLNGTNVAISLDKGNSGTFSPRTLINSGSPLNYNLYIDSNRNSVWGDGTAGTVVYGPTTAPNNTNVNVSIYGRIFPGQMSAKAGNYSDTINMLLIF